MLDWTDLHCRYFHRLLSKHALLYTEMVTTGALLHGDVSRHLRFNAQEHPLALQLGGCEPSDLARCARLGEQWGYDEINLNCGCPSERVQRGAFGASLMKEPHLVVPIGMNYMATYKEKLMGRMDICRYCWANPNFAGQWRANDTRKTFPDTPPDAIRRVMPAAGAQREEASPAIR